MSTTHRLFEHWKAHKQMKSDRAAMETLGLSSGAAVHWKQGRNAEAHVVERMCKDLGEDPVPVILEAFAESARDADAKRSLQRLTKRFRGPALALALGALPLMSPSASYAAALRLDGHSAAQGVFIMRTRQRSRRGVCSEARPSWRRSNRKWKSYPPAFRCSA